MSALISWNGTMFDCPNTRGHSIKNYSYVVRRIFVKQLHGDGDPQPDGLDRAHVDAATAVSAKFRIGNLGNTLVLGTKEYIFGTILRTHTAGRALFGIYDWRHYTLLSLISS